MGWETDHAPRQDELDGCVTCGLCLPHCPTFRLTGSESASPRGRLAAMAAVAAGTAEVDERFEEVMGLCLQCRACEPVCPSVVPFGRAMEGARAEIAVQLPTRRRKLRAWLLGRVLPSRTAVRVASMLAAFAQRLRLHKLPIRLLSRIGGLRRLPLGGPSRAGESRTAAGERVGTAALLIGCVQDAWFGSVNEAAMELLTAAGYDVSAPSGQSCCGALAAHDGAAAATERLAATNVAAFANYDVVVATAAGCSAHLAGYGEWASGGEELADRARDITVVVAEAIADGRLPRLPPRAISVAMQDPCHLRHAQNVVGETREIVSAAGYEPVEIDDKGLCCGAAGAYVLSQPKTSDELGLHKANQVRASEATIVASANPGCEMQLRFHLGDRYDVRHPIELYAEACRGFS
ncbi:MAG: (Fe-S)-binding protein [bacterium]|nr:(Fe-S)-binding protein [bacterium]